MATPRLPFLYPNLFRSVKSCEPKTWQSIRIPPPPTRPRRSKLHTSHRLSQDAQHQRYGPAAEPRLPPPSKPTEPLFSVKQPESNKEATPSPSKDETSSPQSEEVKKETAPPQEAKNELPTASSTQASEYPAKALDTVLQIPTPSEVNGKPEKHPHLEASPYEHHFDTYTLVQDLATRGQFTEDQAVTLMKAIRLMLTINLDIAKEGLVSKSDTENETYLFRAACSELRTTLQTARQAEIQRQRTQRAHLQHEADILSQKMTQDLLTLKEDMKAMFHNRKMAVQEEKQKVDGKISELGYEITVLLNSDAKGDVEGLRWVLTRRAAMAVAIAAFMVLASLNYSGHVTRQRAEVEKKIEAAKKLEEQRREGKHTKPSRAPSTQPDDGGGTYVESVG